jgi:SAM-dependent methyltransferase
VPDDAAVWRGRRPQERVDGHDILDALSAEISLGGSPRGRWYSEYLGVAYRSAVDATMARIGAAPSRVLKTDLWNECLAGDRDIAGHLQQRAGCRVYALDVAYPICGRGRANVPGAHVVQADIRALPFRVGSLDAVLDLSTLDHLPGADVAEAIGEYAQSLRDGGALLLAFWQKTPLIRQRLRLKRLLGRREKPDQSYFARAEVQAKLGSEFMIVEESVLGLLLVLPSRLTARLLGALPARPRGRFLRWLVRVERSAFLHPLLKHLAGLFVIIAVRRRV